MEYFDLAPGESITFGDDEAIRLLVLKTRPLVQKTFLGIITKYTKEECPIVLNKRPDSDLIPCHNCKAKYDYFRLFCSCGANLSGFMGHPWNKSPVVAQLPFNKVVTELQHPSTQLHKGRWGARIAGYRVRLKKEYRIFGRDKKCLHCNSPITKCLLYRKAIDSDRFRVLFADDNYVPFTIDHIHPKSKGGPDALNNYQTLCWNCNNAKGDSLP
jgi:5-methylcytosine-specific restriction endonuclease McrA